MNHQPVYAVHFFMNLSEPDEEFWFITEVKEGQFNLPLPPSPKH